MIKKILLGIGILLALLLLGGFIAGIIAHEPRPEVNGTPEADNLAREVMEMVDCAGWDTTGAISWDFGGRNSHLWDRKRHFARVEWNDFKVLVNINERTGLAWEKGVRLEGKDADDAVDAAWKRWVNDAFWLNPVCKFFDDGTIRSLVTLEDGRQGLMVTYQSGGATPGDSYVWLLGENMPEAWKMWVSIIPVGGVSTTWEGWQTLPTGAKVSSVHGGPMGFQLKIENIQAAATLEALVPGEDPFKGL